MKTKKIKILVLENVRELESEMVQYINTFDEKKYKFDIFISLSDAKPSEIKKRILKADEIVLQSLFVNREQMVAMIELILSCAKEKQEDYKVSVMYGHHNDFRRFLNNTILGEELRHTIKYSMIRIQLNEILLSKIGRSGNENSFFRVDQHTFETQPIFYYEPLNKFIHEWEIENMSSYDINFGIIKLKKQKKENFYDKLSKKEKNVLEIIFKEQKAKLGYELEDKESILKYCDVEEGEEFIEEKESCLELLNKLLNK